MKKETRCELYCIKKLQNGVYDRFSVMVGSSLKNDAKKKYESMGYTASVR